MNYNSTLTAWMNLTNVMWVEEAIPVLWLLQSYKFKKQHRLMYDIRTMILLAVGIVTRKRY